MDDCGCGMSSSIQPDMVYADHGCGMTEFYKKRFEALGVQRGVTWLIRGARRLRLEALDFRRGGPMTHVRSSFLGNKRIFGRALRMSKIASLIKDWNLLGNFFASNLSKRFEATAMRRTNLKTCLDRVLMVSVNPEAPIIDDDRLKPKSCAVVVVGCAYE
uniref:Uncharacterized protein n=1 Tax=Cannabis sativa TaxID=3483 RepID=A0A803QIZ2_CANSA